MKEKKTFNCGDWDIGKRRSDFFAKPNRSTRLVPVEFEMVLSKASEI